VRGLHEILLTADENSSVTSQEILDHIAMHETEYGSAPSLLGNSGDDRECVVWIAACAIAEGVDHAKDDLFVMTAKIRLMEILTIIDFPRRVDIVEALQR